MYTHLGTCITRETVTWRMHIPRKSYRGGIAREAITSSECRYPGTQPHPTQHTPAQIYNYTRRVYTAKGTVLHRECRYQRNSHMENTHILRDVVTEHAQTEEDSHPQRGLHPDAQRGVWPNSLTGNPALHPNAGGDRSPEQLKKKKGGGDASSDALLDFS